MRGNPRAGAIGGMAEGTGFNNEVTIELFDTFEGVAAVTCIEDSLLICVGEGLEIVDDTELLLATCGGDEEMVLTAVFGSGGLVR